MKKVLGIGFLVVAVVVLYFGFVGWPSLDVNIWALFPVGLFLFFTLESVDIIAFVKVFNIPAIGSVKEVLLDFFFLLIRFLTT